MTQTAPQAVKPNVTITYCIGCNWLLRAGWMAQELLQTFQDQLGGVTLIPGDMGGVFEIRLDGDLGTQTRRRFSGCEGAENPRARPD